MEKIDLEQFGPRAHPFKEIFQEHGVKQIYVAGYLGVRPGTLSAMLNGYRRIPKKYHRKLEILIQQLEEECE